MQGKLDREAIWYTLNGTVLNCLKIKNCYFCDTDGTWFQWTKKVNDNYKINFIIYRTPVSIENELAIIWKKITSTVNIICYQQKDRWAGKNKGVNLVMINIYNTKLHGCEDIYIYWNVIEILKYVYTNIIYTLEK